MRKVIAVLGATGAQGGGLVQAILNDPAKEFSVRAITRNPDSDAARTLAKQGADVVKADLDDRNSLVEAFQGAYGAFCVTNYWEHFSPEKEKTQAKNAAEAAKTAGVKHIIWSTLEDSRQWIPLSDDRMPTLMDDYKVPHFDSKGESDAFFINSGVPYTLLETSFYWENFIYFGTGPQRGEDGSLNLVFPLGDARLPGIASADIGKCALGVYKSGNKYQGLRVYVAGDRLTGNEMAEAMSSATGLKIGYYAIDADTYRSFDFPGADDMGNMFQFKRDFEPYFSGVRDPEVARSLNPELQNFEQWLEKNASRIPVPEEELESVQ